MIDTRCRQWLPALRRHCNARWTRPFVIGHRCFEHRPEVVAPYGGFRR